MCRSRVYILQIALGDCIASLKKPTFKRLYEVESIYLHTKSLYTVLSKAGLGGASLWKQLISN